MKPTKQTVYLPVIEDTNLAIIYFKTANGINLGNIKEQEGYFFTPEELNTYTAIVIKQALKTAVEKVRMFDSNEDCFYEDELGNCPEVYVIDNKFAS